MKLIKNILVIQLLLFCFSTVNLMAHESHGSNNNWKRKFEKIWRENGTSAAIQKLSIKYGQTPQERNTVIFLHSEQLQNDKSWFFKNAFTADTTDAYAEKVKSAMVEKSIPYETWMLEFNKLKSENPSEYSKQLGLAEATPPPTPTPTPGALCENPDFENPNPTTGWAFWLGTAVDFDESNPLSGVNFTSVSYPLLSPWDPDRLVLETSGNDPNVGSLLPKVAPGGTKSFRLENRVNGANIAKASITFTVDPSKPYYKYRYAVVLEDPGGDHPKETKPFFMVRLFDVATNSEIGCARYYVAANSNTEKADPVFINEFAEVFPGSAIKYKTWDYNIVPLHAYVNQQVRAEFVVSDCPWGGHLGYAYIDGECLDGTITIGGCNPDGTRNVSAPDFFREYLWAGPGIIGDNFKQSLTINQEGKYKGLFVTNSKCKVVEKFNVQPPCPQPNNTPPCNITATVANVGTCLQNDNLYPVNINLNISGVTDQCIIKITDGKVEKFIFGPFTPSMLVTVPNLVSDGLTHTVKIQVFKTRFITDAMAFCETSITYNAPSPCWVPVFDVPCETCIGSFSPTPGEKYVLAAWVKDASATATTTTFNNPFLELIYNTPSGTVSSGQILGAGKIIEGWQRVYFEFTIPANATAISIKLGSNSGDSYFDDIRVYPINGSMKSYVYDPISLKLVAVLDENNYATLYEYDQEGALIRTKKETERGIVTISENRQNNPKK